MKPSMKPSLEYRFLSAPQSYSWNYSKTSHIYNLCLASKKKIKKNKIKSKVLKIRALTPTVGHDKNILNET